MDPNNQPANCNPSAENHLENSGSYPIAMPAPERPTGNMVSPHANRDGSFGFGAPPPIYDYNYGLDSRGRAPPLGTSETAHYVGMTADGTVKLYSRASPDGTVRYYGETARGELKYYGKHSATSTSTSQSQDLTSFGLNQTSGMSVDGMIALLKFNNQHPDQNYSMNSDQLSTPMVLNNTDRSQNYDMNFGNLNVPVYHYGTYGRDLGDLGLNPDEFNLPLESKNPGLSVSTGPTARKPPAGSEKFIICPICQVEYYYGLLRPHIEADHTIDNIPYCEDCDKSFSTTETLLSHYKTVHNGDGNSNFVCTWANCRASFTRETGLNRHVSVVHMEQRPHKCGYCYKSYSNPKYLDTHIQKHHSGVPSHGST